ncbi:MAG: hypothetical protein RLZZ519_821 [Bacteroidota bacterium]|jgi:hypothetical protein
MICLDIENQMIELKRLEQFIRGMMDEQTPQAIEELVVLHIRTELLETNEYLQENLSDLSFNESTILLKKIQKLSNIAGVLAEIRNSKSSIGTLSVQRDIFFAMKYTKELLMEVLIMVKEKNLPQEEAKEITEVQLIPYSMLEYYLKDRLDSAALLSPEFRNLLATSQNNQP